MVLVRCHIYRDGCEKHVTFTQETIPFFRWMPRIRENTPEVIWTLWLRTQIKFLFSVRYASLNSSKNQENAILIYIAKAFKDFNLIFSAFGVSVVYTALPLPTIPAFIPTCMPLMLWKKKALGYLKINLVLKFSRTLNVQVYFQLFSFHSQFLFLRQTA